MRDRSGFGTVNDLLRHWDDAQRRLDELAVAVDTGDWTDLAELDVRCPVSPGQILQAGANYPGDPRLRATARLLHGHHDPDPGAFTAPPV